MKLFKFLLLGILPTALLSTCTLFNSEENVIKISSSLPKVKNQFIPSVVWSSSVGDGIGKFYSHLHPAFANGIIYAADRKGIVCAFDANNGKKIWSINLARKSCSFSYVPELLSGGITISGNHLYIGSEKAWIYALNTSDGSISWKTRVIGEALSHPVVSNGMVLIHTSNGQLQALDQSNGIIEWTVNLGVPFLSLRGESTPAIVSGTAIIGSDNGRVSAILIRNGQIIWQQRISQISNIKKIDHLNDVDITPVVVNSLVYVSSCDGNLMALDLQSGQIIWKREFGTVNNFIVHNNRIYLVDQNDRLLAISAENGVTLWIQNDLLHRLLTAPVLYNSNLLVVGDGEGYIHWINLETGSFVSQQRINNSGFLSEPIMADEKLLIQAKDGMLYSITC